MRLLKLGTFDAVHALTSYTAQDAPALEGIDLAGVIQDFGVYRKAMAAYKPVIERELKEKFNAKMLMLYTFPKQQFFCSKRVLPTAAQRASCRLTTPSGIRWSRTTFA